MEQDEIIQAIAKQTLFQRLPKWLRIVIIILSIVTLIYWACWLVYKFLKYLRVFLHWATDSRNWWTFIVCLLILLIGSFIVSQFVLGLDPIGQFVKWLSNLFNSIKETFINWIS